MKSCLSIVFALVPALLASGCASVPSVTIAALPADGADGRGIPFVIPRTVIRVEADKTGRIGFTAVPVAYAEDGKTVLPRFLLSDAGGALALSATTVTAVAYADELIVKEIGTQVLDRRKDALDAVAGIAALAVSVRAPGDCATPPPLRPFVIDAVRAGVARRAPNNPCWGYAVAAADFVPVALRAYPVDALAAAGAVAWFPIAACRPYAVTVYPCGDAACTPMPDGATTAVLAASDGSAYRRVPLPAKGSVSLHPDFCQADVTNGSVGSNDWALLNQALSEVKAARR